MKKIIAILMSMSMVLAVGILTACTAKTENAPEATEAAEANGIEGKYIAVAQTLSDIWTYNPDESFELKKDGEAIWNSYGMEFDATWEEQEDGTIKITYGAGEKIVEPYTEQEGAYVIKDSDTSYTIYAKEGSPAADASLYMPENEKNMIGTWKTDAVEDIFGDDKSGEIAADALTIEIKADQTAHVIYNGEDLGTTDWFMMDDWGGVNSEEPKYTVSWTIKDDGVSFDVVKDDKMYTFRGVKQ